MSISQVSTDNNVTTQNFGECLRKLNEEHANMQKTIDKYRIQNNKLDLENKNATKLIESLYRELKQHKGMQKSLLSGQWPKLFVIPNSKTKSSEDDLCNKIKFISDCVKPLLEHSNHLETFFEKQEAEIMDLRKKINIQMDAQVEILKEKDNEFKVLSNQFKTMTIHYENKIKSTNEKFAESKKQMKYLIKQLHQFHCEKHEIEKRSAATIRSLEQKLEQKESLLKNLTSNIRNFETRLSQCWTTQLENMKQQIGEIMEEVDHCRLSEPAEDTSLTKSRYKTNECVEDLSGKNKLVGDKEEVK